MMNSGFDEGFDGFLCPFQASEKNSVPVAHVDTIKTGNGVAKETEDGKTKVSGSLCHNIEDPAMAIKKKPNHFI